jgi:hypothetical protein
LSAAGIRALTLGGSTASTFDITLNNLFTEVISGGFDGADINLTLRDNGAGLVNVGDGTNTITTGNGSVGFIALASGTNTVNGASGRIGAIDAGSGDETITLIGGATSISLGSGPMS